MKKLNGIRIIKRDNRRETAAPEANEKQNGRAGERELAKRIAGWVDDVRRRRHSEEARHTRVFFRESRALAN